MLHRPLLQSSNLKGEEEFPDNENFPATFMPKASLNTLTALLTNTDPAPGLISSLLTPIIPSIYSLLHALEEHKTSDPTFKASVRGLLETWGRLVGEAEGVASLWLIVDGDGGYWSVDVAGQITRHEEECATCFFDYCDHWFDLSCLVYLSGTPYPSSPQKIWSVQRPPESWISMQTS